MIHKDPNYTSNLEYAKSLAAENKQDEMMPRSAFWAPITASRYLSLFDKYGDDDFFSSDLTNDELNDRLGFLREYYNHGLRLVVAFGDKDRYIPESIDKRLLLERLVRVINSGCDSKIDTKDRLNPIATGIMLESSNHNLGKNEKDRQLFLNYVREGLKKCLNSSNKRKDFEL